jgi:hypothetical protein
MHGARTTLMRAGSSPVSSCSRSRSAPEHRAGDAVADPDRQRRGRRLALPDDVEVGVERRDLVGLGLRHPHLLGQRREVRRRDVPVPVLDQVEVLDQQVAAARQVAQQRPHLVQRPGRDLPPARGHAPAALALAGVRRPALAPVNDCGRHSLP